MIERTVSRQNTCTTELKNNRQKKLSEGFSMKQIQNSVWKRTSRFNMDRRCRLKMKPYSHTHFLYISRSARPKHRLVSICFRQFQLGRFVSVINKSPSDWIRQAVSNVWPGMLWHQRMKQMDFRRPKQSLVVKWTMKHDQWEYYSQVLCRDARHNLLFILVLW